MAHTFSETPHRVGTHPESRQACNITRSAHSNSDLARSCGPLQRTFRTVTFRESLQRRTNAVMASARTAPVRALTVSTGVGILIGLSVAAGRVASTASHRDNVFRRNCTMRLADKRARGWRHFFRWV